MSDSEINTKHLDQALAELGRNQFSISEKSLNSKLNQRLRTEKRHALWAIIGLVVSSLAALIFILQSEPFGYFAMPLVIAVFIGQIYRSRKQAQKYASLDQAQSLLSVLQAETAKQIKQYKLIGPWALFVFSVLTAFVIHSHGLGSGKSWFYLLTAACIAVYVLYRFFITVPELQREIQLYSHGKDI